MVSVPVHAPVNQFSLRNGEADTLTGLSGIQYGVFHWQNLDVSVIGSR